MLGYIKNWNVILTILFFSHKKRHRSQKKLHVITGNRQFFFLQTYLHILEQPILQFALCGKGWSVNSCV